MAVLGPLLVAGAVIVAPSAQAAPERDEKVRICHRANATTNPYRSIEVAASSVDGAGGGDHFREHTGPIWTPAQRNGGDWGDIIPPVGSHQGLNWNAEGIAIWMNGCAPAVPVDTDEDGDPDIEDPDDDGDGRPDIVDPDDDGDGTEDTDDPDREITTDTDEDGVPDGLDPDNDGDGIRDGDDPDSDGDGTPDGSDPDEPTAPDTDGDGTPDDEDADEDGDCVVDAIDADADGDGIADGIDRDDDGDGIPNGRDLDNDGDEIPDVLDSDDDGNGVPDVAETAGDPVQQATIGVRACVGAPIDPSGDDHVDTDGDGTTNDRDPDDDGDGTRDDTDPDQDGDGTPDSSDPDDDGDGLIDSEDPDHRGDVEGDRVDSDGDGTPDVGDRDADNDGVPNSQDGDRDGDGQPETQRQATVEPFAPVTEVSSGDPVLIIPREVETTAGLQASTEVRCAPGTRLRPTGDAGSDEVMRSLCRVVERNGVTRVRVLTDAPTVVTIEIVAPASGPYRSLFESSTYLF